MGSSPTKTKRDVQPTKSSRTLRNLKSNEAEKPVQSGNILNDDNRILNSQSISSYHFDPPEDFAPNQNVNLINFINYIFYFLKITVNEL